MQRKEKDVHHERNAVFGKAQKTKNFRTESLSEPKIERKKIGKKRIEPNFGCLTKKRKKKIIKIKRILIEMNAHYVSKQHEQKCI